VKRFSSIDAMKVVAAFLVMTIHVPFPGVIGEIVKVIARIAVPFFFVVSGFFLYSIDKNEINIKTIHSIKNALVLVVTANVAYFLWEIVKTILVKESIYFYISNTFTIKNAVMFFIFNDSPVGEHLWYLSAYLYALLIFYLLNKYSLTKYSYFFIPLLLIIDLVFGKYSLLIWYQNFNQVFMRNFLFNGLPYILLGNWLRGILETRTIKISNSLLLVGIMLFSLTSLLEKYFLVINNLDTAREHYLSTAIIVLCLFTYLAKNPSIFKDRLIEKIGRENSLHLYIIHFAIAQIVLTVIARFGKIQNILSYLAVIIVFFISLFISIIYNKSKKLLQER
jgi:surface polysaccharide O-acyltransferase-like enzyme